MIGFLVVSCDNKKPEPNEFEPKFTTKHSSCNEEQLGSTHARTLLIPQDGYSAISSPLNILEVCVSTDEGPRWIKVDVVAPVEALIWVKTPK